MMKKLRLLICGLNIAVASFSYGVVSEEELRGACKEIGPDSLLDLSDFKGVFSQENMSVIVNFCTENTMRSFGKFNLEKSPFAPAFCNGALNGKEYEAFDEQSDGNKNEDDAYDLIHGLHFTAIMQQLA